MEFTLFKENKKEDNNIFKMFDPDGEDNFLDMSEKELRDFLLLLENYRMFYRDELNINSKNTFGTEIECVRANVRKIINSLRNSDSCSKWKYKRDLSLPRDREIIEVDGVRYVIKSLEFITDVLNNKKWDDLYNGCYIISNNAMINNCCGGHVHVGSQILGRKKQNWIDFFSLWSAYEDVAYRFSSGCDRSFRKGGEAYAYPVSQLFQKKLKRVSSNLPFDRLIDVFGDCKNNAVNLDHVDRYNVCDTHYGNTVEFRVFNGSYNPIIIQNNINFSVHLMEYAASRDFDAVKVLCRREELNDSFGIFNYSKVISYYNDIDLYKSMELADMIFSNNLDKINFLKQCVKSVRYMEDREADNKRLIR